MPPNPAELTAIAEELLAGRDFRLVSCDVIQKLWQGYGYICRTNAIDNTGAEQSLILKYIKPPSAGRVDSEGHIRKIISYEVEQYFYSNLAPSLPPGAAVAKCHSSINQEGKVALLLEDLQKDYPVAGEKRATLNETQVYAVIKWLGTFHGFWWDKTSAIRTDDLRLPPLEEVETSHAGKRVGVWWNGGYTYLATRTLEYASLCQDTTSEWSQALCTPVLNSDKSIAQLAARVLSPHSGILRDYETLIHGDVKSENLFTTSSGQSCAFFDFQYVGLGCGLSDLAKLCTCSVPTQLLDSPDHQHSLPMGKGEKLLLEYYHRVVESVSGKKYPWDLFMMHWQTALVDWLRFQASWGFWGNTGWLEARGRWILSDEEWLNWLRRVSV